MHTTLDILEEPCQGEQSRWETASTTIGHGSYEGFWASSVAVGIVVEDDRIAGNPINHRDPSGLLSEGAELALNFALFGVFGLLGGCSKPAPSVAPTMKPSGEFVIRDKLDIPPFLAESPRYATKLVKFKGYSVEYIPAPGIRPDDVKLVQVIDSSAVPGVGSGPDIDVRDDGLDPTKLNRYDWTHDKAGSHTSNLVDGLKWGLPGYIEGGGSSYHPADFNSTGYFDAPGADWTRDFDFPIEVLAVLKSSNAPLGAVHFIYHSKDQSTEISGATIVGGNYHIPAGMVGDLFNRGAQHWANSQGGRYGKL